MLAHWLPDSLCLVRLILSICKPRLLLHVRFFSSCLCPHPCSTSFKLPISLPISLTISWTSMISCVVLGVFWTCATKTMRPHAPCTCPLCSKFNPDTQIHSWVHFCSMNKCGESSQKPVRWLGIIERHMGNKSTICSAWGSKHMVEAKGSTVQHRLSRPCLSGTSIIRISWRPENTSSRMHRRCDRWSFVGVVTGRAMSCGLYRFAMDKTDWPGYFFKYCWPWSYCIGRLQVRYTCNKPGEKHKHFRYLDISLIWYGRAAISPWTGCTVHVYVSLLTLWRYCDVYMICLDLQILGTVCGPW